MIRERGAVAVGNGGALPGGADHLALPEGFWDRVGIGPGCWNWRGALGGSTGSYGYYTVYPEKRTWRVHRLMWTAIYEPIPDGLLVMHRCNNPRFVRPDHLELGTHTDNARYREQCGRGRRQNGELDSYAKLTAEQVLEMRRLAATGISAAEVGRMFGVSEITGWEVVTGRTWAHLPLAG